RVRYPIFTIHGNHDDPVGADHVGAVDLLASAGLVNYFGKRDQVEQVTLKPIVIRKGPTLKVALYGMGSMHEGRLQGLIERNQLHFLAPTKSPSEYLKILVVHQNRIPRPNVPYLRPADLTKLPDLVV